MSRYPCATVVLVDTIGLNHDVRLRAWAFVSLLFFSSNINVRSVEHTNVACLIPLKARSNSVGLYQLL